MDTDFLDWALADFSGYVAADELYDGPFCILSAVDNRCDKRLLYDVVDHAPDHDDIRAFLGRLKAALTARDVTLVGLTTDGSALSPEPLAEVKLFAPNTFRKELARAITEDDYGKLAERNNRRVQRAAAALRWTGSWYEALVTIDPAGTEDASQALLTEIATSLEPYRRIGHDLVVAPARDVPLDVELTICVLPHYLRGHVEAALLDVFSHAVLPGGTKGFFHPDNLTFGEDVYASALVAAAQAVPGVQSVEVTKLERYFEGPNDEVQNGVLALGPLEVARLDNDPSFPENGRLVLEMRGGR